MHYFKKLNKQQMKDLYNAYVVYRDKYCEGWAILPIIEYHKLFGSEEFILNESTEKHTMG